MWQGSIYIIGKSFDNTILPNKSIDQIYKIFASIWENGVIRNSYTKLVVINLKSSLCIDFFKIFIAFKNVEYFHITYFPISYKYHTFDC